MIKHIAKVVAVFAIAAVILPSLASAHGMDNQDRNWTTNEFGVKVFDSNANLNSNTNTNINSDKDNDNEDNNDQEDNHGLSRGMRDRVKDKEDNNGLHLGHIKDHGFMANLFYNGTVTATSSTGFTIKAKDGTTFTIDTDSAKIVRIPHTVIALAGINVGDTVHITGQKTDSDSIKAIVVYVLPANLKPAIATGTVTAVNGTTGAITVQTKDDGTTITVNTDSDTHFSDNNSNTNDSSLTSADVQVGMKAKLFGLWDSVLNVFNAIKVKLV